MVLSQICRQGHKDLAWVAVSPQRDQDRGKNGESGKKPSWGDCWVLTLLTGEWVGLTADTDLPETQTQPETTRSAQQVTLTLMLSPLRENLW